MARSNNINHLFAAVCYTVCIVASLIRSISWIQYIIWLALAIPLFMNNKKAFVYSAGASSLWWLISYYVVRTRVDWIGSMIFFLAYAILAVITVMSIKKNSIVKKIWYLAAVLLLIGYLYLWIGYGYFSYLSSSWLRILLDIIEIVAVALVGMWNRDFPKPSEVNRTYSTANVQPSGITQDPSKLGGADKIKMYKELLDSGVITQDEFDTKKKQILGL